MAGAIRTHLRRSTAIRAAAATRAAWRNTRRRRRSSAMAKLMCRATGYRRRTFTILREDRSGDGRQGAAYLEGCGRIARPDDGDVDQYFQFPVVSLSGGMPRPGNCSTHMTRVAKERSFTFRATLTETRIAQATWVMRRLFGAAYLPGLKSRAASGKAEHHKSSSRYVHIPRPRKRP